MYENLKRCFLIKLLVRNDISDELQQSIGTCKSDVDVLYYLRQQGCLSVGITKDDYICQAPNNSAWIDNLLFGYFREKEKRFIQKMI